MRAFLSPAEGGAGGLMARQLCPYVPSAGFLLNTSHLEEQGGGRGEGQEKGNTVEIIVL